METRRLEAFSDGVLAIIITIMVLEMKVPHGADVGALRPLLPVFLSYVLSFVYLGIYWNNHHHMLHVTHGVTGAILWANLHLLFWLSLIPFVTGWMGENNFAPTPTALYGVVLLLAALAYLNLQRVIIGLAGAGFGPGAGDRPRPQGEDLPRPLCHRDSGRVCARGHRRQHLRAGGADLAGPRPPHREGTGEQKTLNGPPLCGPFDGRVSGD